MIEITDTQVADGLKALVAEYGEKFVYQRHVTSEGIEACRYVHDGQPDCIVGKFLAAVGVPVERLEVADGINFGQVADELLEALEGEGLVKISRNGVNALIVAQSRQDAGFTWGYAVEEALHLVR